MPNSTANIDILIATDCISEGQNLQDCDYLVNYDIHWNPA
ncbi:MAG: helicase-related protein [Blautia sp.]